MKCEDFTDQDLVTILAYVKKRGSVLKLRYVEKKWIMMGRNEHISLLLREISIDKVVIGRLADNIYVKIMDCPWADNLAIRFGKEQPHHGQAIMTIKKHKEHIKNYK